MNSTMQRMTDRRNIYRKLLWYFFFIAMLMKKVDYDRYATRHLHLF